MKVYEWNGRLLTDSELNAIAMDRIIQRRKRNKKRIENARIILLGSALFGYGCVVQLIASTF